MAGQQTRSGYYNNPAYAQAADNIASMFKPPSPQDMYAAAKTRQTNQETNVMAEFLGTHNVTPEEQENAAIKLGIYNPNQSFYAVDQGNQTTLSKQRLANQGALAVQHAKPVVLSEGSTAYLPQSTQDATGLGSMFSGGVKLNQGQSYTAPSADGSISTANTKILGEPKPMTSNSGANFVMPSGEATYARFNEQGVPVDAYTGQPLPAGSTKYGTSLQSNNMGDLAPTKSNVTDANRMSAMLDSNQLLAQDFRTLLQNNPGIVGVPGNVRGLAQDLRSVVGEMSAAFDGQGDRAVQRAELENWLAPIAGQDRDPAIQKARSMVMNVAYARAQMRNPTGEVSQQALLRSLEEVSGGLLTNNQSLLEGLDAFDDEINRGRTYVSRLRNPQPQEPEASVQPRVVNFNDLPE